MSVMGTNYTCTSGKEVGSMICDVIHGCICVLRIDCMSNVY